MIVYYQLQKLSIKITLLNCRIDGLNNFKPDLLIIDRFLKLKKKLELFDLTKKKKHIFLQKATIKKNFFF